MDKETGIFNGGKLKHSVIHAQKIEGERDKDTIEMGPFAALLLNSTSWFHGCFFFSSDFCFEISGFNIFLILLY